MCLLFDSKFDLLKMTFTGITSLLGNGVYTAAYPLHDVGILPHILSIPMQSQALCDQTTLIVSLLVLQGDVDGMGPEANDRKVRRANHRSCQYAINEVTN